VGCNGFVDLLGEEQDCVLFKKGVYFLQFHLLTGNLSLLRQQ